MRVTQRMMADNLQRNIGYNAENLASLQDQLSSGKRLRKLSDDPQALSRALALRAVSDQNLQYVRNIESARGWMAATGGALDRLSSVLIRARDLALRGATGSLGDEERKALGRQVDALLGEALQAVNSTYEGKYLFAGYRITAAPFAADGSFTQAPGGPAGDMKREIRPGVEIVVNVRANFVVDGQMPLQRTLTALNGLRDQLSTGGDSSAYLSELAGCLDGVVAMQGTMGVRMSQLDVNEEALNDEQVDVTVMLSRVQDADAAETISKLMAQETVYRAALSAGARALQSSLLDFLR